VSSISWLPIADDLEAVRALVKSVEDPAIEDQEQRRRRMGRWRREVSEVSADPLFWQIMHLHHKVTGVIEHHMAFLSQKKSPDFVATHGNKVSRLVTGKAIEILGEYEALLSDVRWVEPVVRTPTASLDKVSDLLALVVELVGHHAASYFRRVVHALDKSRPQSHGRESVLLACRIHCCGPVDSSPKV
jgi:hypothetical protein